MKYKAFYKTLIIFTKQITWTCFAKQHNWSGENSYRKTKLNLEKYEHYNWTTSLDQNKSLSFENSNRLKFWIFKRFGVLIPNAILGCSIKFPYFLYFRGWYGNHLIYFANKLKWLWSRITTNNPWKIKFDLCSRDVIVGT